jgi:hypothetical protein
MGAAWERQGMCELVISERTVPYRLCVVASAQLGRVVGDTATYVAVVAAPSAFHGGLSIFVDLL